MGLDNDIAALRSRLEDIDTAKANLTGSQVMYEDPAWVALTRILDALEEAREVIGLIVERHTHIVLPSEELFMARAFLAKYGEGDQ